MINSALDLGGYEQSKPFIGLSAKVIYVQTTAVLSSCEGIVDFGRA